MYTKRKKGDAGYISKRKIQVLIKTLIEFGIALALLILGIQQTGDRMNILTIVAVLGCLPASKSLVELIMIVPHHSIAQQKVSDIEEKADCLTRVYDMVFTSEKKVMPVECIVIGEHTVCGYTSYTKHDVTEIEKHLKQLLDANQFSKVTVKIFEDYNKFLLRIQDMNQNISADHSDMKNLLLNISL